MKPKLIAIGYWHSIYEPEFPDPANFEDTNWNIKERDLVLEHLKKGKAVANWMGVSWCRYRCGENNMGASCLSDGIYIFPDKLTHYLNYHDTRLPYDFVIHVKTYTPVNIPTDIREYEIDYDWWWKQQQGFNKHTTSKTFLASTNEEIRKFEKRKRIYLES